MEVSEAIDLIKPAALATDRSQVWADLGCGSGIFGQALASLLPDQSTVVCCDKEPQMFSLDATKRVTLQFKQLDFEQQVLDISLDGILMANALHYVEDQKNFLLKWKQILNPAGAFIIVEYDTEVSNPWVPFPVSFSKLKTLFSDIGMKSVRMLGDRKSVYGNNRMYACEIKI